MVRRREGNILGWEKVTEVVQVELKSDEFEQKRAEKGDDWPLPVHMGYVRLLSTSSYGYTYFGLEGIHIFFGLDFVSLHKRLGFQAAPE